MTTLTVTATGRVTLPKDILDHLGVRPGEKISVESLPDGRIEVKAAGKISDVFDIFKRENGPRLSIEDMERILNRGGLRKR